jgi:DNA modification methylase
MFSVKGDIVLEPFAGIGTTMFAALLNCKNFIC